MGDRSLVQEATECESMHKLGVLSLAQIEFKGAKKHCNSIQSGEINASTHELLMSSSCHFCAHILGLLCLRTLLQLPSDYLALSS